MAGIDLGPLRLVAVDEDGRRFPCHCHTEPVAWQIWTTRPLYQGKVGYVIVPMPKNLEPVAMRVQLENALDTLDDMVAHPELYISG